MSDVVDDKDALQQELEAHLDAKPHLQRAMALLLEANAKFGRAIAEMDEISSKCGGLSDEQSRMFDVLCSGASQIKSVYDAFDAIGDENMAKFRSIISRLGMTPVGPGNPEQQS